MRSEYFRLFRDISAGALGAGKLQRRGGHQWERTIQCHSGMRLLAQARNPYSRSWLWIPGSLAALAPRNDDDNCVERRLTLQSCILEKSATARVAARISLSSLRRFSCTFTSSSLTFTLSKNASTAGRNFAIALIAPAKSSWATAALASVFT